MKITNRFIPMLMVVVCLLNYNTLMAQSGTPQEVFAKIYKAYDSSNYLSFNIKYTYSSDTLDGDFMYDVLEGTYTLAGKKAKFNLGDIEFMQNDSFFITVYNNDRFILVSNPRNSNAGKELPMRQIMDTLAADVLDHYTMNVRNVEDTAFVDFYKQDSTAQFLKFSLVFDTNQNIIHSVEYVYEEAMLVNSLENTIPAVIRKKRLKVDFSNYRFDNFSDSLYDENKYIFFEDGICKPIDKYNEFKIYNSHSPVISN